MCHSAFHIACVEHYIGVVIDAVSTDGFWMSFTKEREREREREREKEKIKKEKKLHARENIL
jgi:hypothetical protein